MGDRLLDGWVEANRVGHKQISGALLGRTDDSDLAISAREGEVSLDLAAAVERVKQQRGLLSRFA